jgi:hypothetical protein
MWRLKSLLIAAPVAAGLLAAPAADAQWRHPDHWHHGYERHHEEHGNGALTGALVGLGVAAVVGGLLASQAPYSAPPPVVYAPPPPPAYYPAPAYAPPGYYATTPYYGQ